ncbi:MAG: DUF4124 domain-containing protein [Gammaproteobacteria bacterium]
MKTWLLVLLLVVIFGVGFAQAQTVYRWVDPQGNVHYSDHPHPGADKVTLPKTQTYAAPSTAGIAPTQPLPAAAPSAGYHSFTLASPGNEATLWYTHEVTVSVALNPALKPGDSITYRLDGKSIGPTVASAVTFKDIDRGEHKASATLTAANGMTMTAGPVTFYVRQKSILSPKPHHTGPPALN